jgi:predicted metal-dependent hydrolase
MVIDKENYSLIRSKRKTVAISISHDGKVIVRAPFHLAKKAIDELVLSKKTWIDNALMKVSNRISLDLPAVLEEHSCIRFLGTFIHLSFWEGSFIKMEETLKFPLQWRGKNERYYLQKWYEAEANILLSKRTLDLSLAMNCPFKKITINKAQKRWGSCNQKGALNLSWYLVMLPWDLIDYVITHELIHTRHMNHSIHFWNEIKKNMPDAQQRRKELKKYTIVCRTGT